ncbi:MAG: acetyl-CoA C-acyltransferase [Desulfuromonas sp.]|nr:MAG: acetyl-CoA C-acyltransferase [Desulfuromonas sp.]
MPERTAYQGGRPVYIVDGLRTPFIKFRGTPGPFSASDLAVTAGKALLLRQSFAPDELDEVILGCISPAANETNIGRLVALRLGCGNRVPAWTVQRNCGSGMQAIDNAAQQISSGRSDLVLAGGTESMSHAPLLLSEKTAELLGRWNQARSLGQRLKLLGQLRPGHFKPVISLLVGLTDPVVNLSMGQTAENLAKRFDIDREAMDRFALESHQRVAAAQQEDRFSEITPLFAANGTVYTEDDGVRKDTDLESLGRLKPAFDRPFGLVTAGNSAQVTDGAALLLLASKAAVKRYNLPVLGRVLDSNWAGVDPAQMGLGPAHAMAPLLQRNALSTDQVDAWEINEAFAAQVLACLAAWQDPDYAKEDLGLEQPFDPIPQNLLNMDGGAVALGHPVGSSGARIVLHLLHALQQRDGKTGVASLCIGGGQGGAMLIERTREV